MPTLTIRSVPEQLHERLKGRAERNRRSLNAETVVLLEQALETFPEDAELRRQLRALRRQTRQRSPLDADALLCLLRDRHDRLRALGVRRIGLFGSVLRGESRADSDVDLLVEFHPGRKSFDGLLELATYLEDLLQRRVDLVTTEGLSPYIGPKILQEAEFVRVSD